MDINLNGSKRGLDTFVEDNYYGLEDLCHLLADFKCLSKTMMWKMHMLPSFRVQQAVFYIQYSITSSDVFVTYPKTSQFEFTVCIYSE